MSSTMAEKAEKYPSLLKLIQQGDEYQEVNRCLTKPSFRDAILTIHRARSGKMAVSKPCSNT